MPSPSEVRTPLSTSPRFSALSASLSRRQRTSYCSAVSDSCSDFLMACVNSLMPQSLHTSRADMSSTVISAPCILLS